MSERIKILIIEDSGLMRILLSEILRADITIDVVGTAKNGMEGVVKARLLRPDVIVTDMVMPEYDGLFVVRTIMEQMPLPIVLLSSLHRTSPQVFDALREGAFDFLDKPQKEDLAKGYPQLLNLVREASLSDFVRIRQPNKNVNHAVHSFEARLLYDILVIGASTGGPSAIESIIVNLPSNFALPVVIAQHMPERFIVSFASRLATLTNLLMSVANNGESPLPGRVYFAPGNCNLQVVNPTGSPTFHYTSQRYREFNDPSIDCVFESVASVYGKRAMGVVLTGMGRDGATGLLKIRKAGGFTVSQDEATSVVYGMPRAAFESGAAQHSVPLHEIPNFITSAL